MTIALMSLAIKKPQMYFCRAYREGGEPLLQAKERREEHIRPGRLLHLEGIIFEHFFHSFFNKPTKRIKAMKIHGLYIFNPHRKEKETKQAKKDSFNNFFANFKTDICFAISWQRSLCFGCTSVRHLLNKDRASPLYSVYPERRNSQFPIAGHPQANGREKARSPQGEENPDFSLRVLNNRDKVFNDMDFLQCTGWLESDGTRAG